MTFNHPPGRIRRRLRWIVGVTAIAITALVTTSAATAPAAPAASAHPTPMTRQNWHDAMVGTATPAKGCYSASYPTVAWRSVACTTAPNVPFAPKAGSESPGSAEAAGAGVAGTEVRPEVVGNGTDYSAQVTGLMSGATGSFTTVAGVTSETGAGVANTYSLQLNSRPFVSPVCAGRAGCQGWEQFIYSNKGAVSASTFIQFWLLNFGAACLAGWTPFGASCYKDGPAVAVPPQPIGNLANLSLSGTATGGAGGTDTASMSIGATILSSSTTDSTLGLAAGWTAVEFMIGGNGSGTQAVFNAGSTLVVQTVTHNGTTAAPTCLTQGWTGETNNLTLSGTAAFASGPSPAIRSTQSNPAGTAKSCAAATGQGDTHLETFGGTYYDFQSEGTYTLAQTSTMTVQSQQISGAPTWPQAAVNDAVATQMGSDTVALCNPGTLVVDGSSTALADGSSVTLASGDTISRTGNVYVITDPQGDSLTATMNGTYINASVGLGTYPEAVSGLLANAPGTNNELETSTGTIINTPVDLTTLYDVYGDSWRVAPANSLVAVCKGPVENADPTTPFWADELPQNTEAQAQAVCQQDGVTDPTLLEACTLDVAVLGGGAATSYEGEAPPVDVGFSEDDSGGPPSGTDSLTSPLTGTPTTTGFPTRILTESSK